MYWGIHLLSRNEKEMDDSSKYVQVRKVNE